MKRTSSCKRATCSPPFSTRFVYTHSDIFHPQLSSNTGIFISCKSLLKTFRNCLPPPRLQTHIAGETFTPADTCSHLQTLQTEQPPLANRQGAMHLLFRARLHAKHCSTPPENICIHRHRTIHLLADRATCELPLPAGGPFKNPFSYSNSPPFFSKSPAC